MRWLLLVACLSLSGGALSLDDETHRARVVDAAGGRIPEHTVAPVYPRKARRDRVEGEVQVCFEVDRKGRPRRVGVRKSTHRIFERPSINAVKKSSFRAVPADQEVPSLKTCRTFVFSLRSISLDDPDA